MNSCDRAAERTRHIARLHSEMTLWRRELHAYPELGFGEHRTANFVAEKLASWGIAVTRGIAGTGLVGTLSRGIRQRAIGLRADMDALPVCEANAFSHASTVGGCMHACGHDGHTAMLLGAAEFLATRGVFEGTVQLIFQPAEECAAGAKAMLGEDLFGRFPVDQVYAVHNDPGLPLGHGSVVSGPVQAAVDTFSVEITGVGGHAARPHLTVDPVVVGAQIVVALQSIVSRAVDALDSAVLTVTQFHAGNTDNVISPAARLSGTVRTLRGPVQDRVEALLKSISTGIAATHGASANVAYQRLCPPTVNHTAQSDRAAAALHTVIGEEHVIRQRPPVMGGEDFSFMLIARPGCFVRLGQASGTRGCAPLHHPNYDFNDDLLPIGAGFFAALVEQELAP